MIAEGLDTLKNMADDMNEVRFLIVFVFQCIKHIYTQSYISMHVATSIIEKKNKKMTKNTKITINKFSMYKTCIYNQQVSSIMVELYSSNCISHTYIYLYKELE